MILDRNGKELGRIFVQNREPISIDKVSENFINALLAAESANIGDFDNLYDLRSKRLATESLLGVSPFAGASAESGLLGGEGLELGIEGGVEHGG